MTQDAPHQKQIWFLHTKKLKEKKNCGCFKELEQDLALEVLALMSSLLTLLGWSL